MDKYGYGIQGEELAKKYLESKNFVILDSNVNFPNVGEIDRVAQDGKTLVFVEVRTRADCSYGNPLETLTKSKITKIVKASRMYLREKSAKIYESYRYDVIGIVSSKVTHIANAFYARW